jgi:hypothetical protein
MPCIIVREQVLNAVRTDIRLFPICRRKSRESRARASQYMRPRSGLHDALVQGGRVDNHLDTRFYRPKHKVRRGRPLSGWVPWPDVLKRGRAPGGQNWQSRVEAGDQPQGPTPLTSHEDFACKQAGRRPE